ncbi:LuxR-family transcriptional regulator [Streptomyces hygroscopicus subsp. jinggangensis 5008]|nr:LuxR-family transcriptional regulator [Streptomyces hygroscopicus subsp. jinggangensis 5008]AGF59750.1 LuxR-family transcriptional regulator [Streptomyces hygroscopicus subsp. jinggangensis TL01]
MPPLESPRRHITGLVGRRYELSVVERLVAPTRHGAPGTLFVGEPGVGKTALLDAAEDAAVRRGVRVLRAAGVEVEADLPYAGLHQLLLPLHEELSHLQKDLRTALRAALGLEDAPVRDQLLVCNATLTLLVNAARGPGLLVIVDDLHWMNPTSAGVVAFVARRLGAGRLSLLAAGRTEAEKALRPLGIRMHQLTPLNEAESDDLLNAHHPDLDGATRRRVLNEARGNPLALLELPTALTWTGVESDSFATTPVTRRIQDLYAARLEGASDLGRRLLLLAALDATGDCRLLSITDSQAEAMEALAKAERDRLIEFDSQSGRLTFPHPLIRSTIITLASGADRRWAHNRLASLFDGQPDRQVWHLAAAAVAPDSEIAGLLEQTGHRSFRRGDGAGATSAFMHAARLSTDPGESSRRLALAAYARGHISGELRQSSRMLVEMRRMSSLPPLHGALACAHQLLNSDGDVDAAHRLLTTALLNARLEEDDYPSTTAEALYLLMMCAFFGGRGELWQPVRVLLGELGSRTPPAIALSWGTLADPARASARALKELDMALGGLTESADPSHIVRVALAAAFVDRLPDCRSALRQVARAGLEGQAPVLGLNAQMLLGRDLFWTGGWDEATKTIDDAVALCLSSGYLILSTPGRYAQGMLASLRGDYDTAEAIAEELMGWAGPRNIRLIECYGRHIRALAALSRGDYENAYRQTASIVPPGALPPHAPHALVTQLDLVEAAIRTGRHAEAAAHATALVEAGVRTISSRQALVTDAVAALVAPEEMTRLRFDETLALPEVGRWPFDLARVQLLYGERLRRMRAVQESRAQLRAALETFQRLRAQPWVERAANELRATGEGETIHSFDSHEVLTHQERLIAQLAASGLTNKQIGERLSLSPRTVSGHLYHLFPKLGISSRAALRDALDSQVHHEPPAST